MSELHEIQGNRGDWFLGGHSGQCGWEAWISKQSYIVRIKSVGRNFGRETPCHQYRGIMGSV